MALGAINDKGIAQTLGGQPTVAASTGRPGNAGEGSSSQASSEPSAGTPTVQTVPGDGGTANQGDSVAAATIDASVQPNVAPAVPPKDGGTVSVDVNIPPEALKQITTLSSSLRQTKKELDDLRAKSSSTETEISTKLKRLEALEEAYKSPRKFFEMSGKTLEDVSKEYYEKLDSEAIDPRVDALASTVEAQKVELEKLKTERETEKTQTQTQAQRETTSRGISFVQDKLNTGASERWSTIAKNAKAAEDAYVEANKVYERDFAEVKDAEGNITRAEKPLTKEAAIQLIEDALDRAEATEIAKQILADRKNRKTSGQEPALPVGRRGGIHLQEEPMAGTSSERRVGITIDPNRSPAGTVPRVERGQTDVRTAKARALKMVGG